MRPGEEPIEIYIYRFGAKDNLVSHAAMKFGRECIDYSSKGFKKSTGPHEDAHVYYLYPSELGIDPKKLTEAMKERKKQIKGSDYEYFGENCAKQVIACLEKARAGDVPRTLGISVPSLVGKGDLEGWAKEHGYYQGQTMAGEKSIKYYNQFREAMEVLCRREEFKQEMEKEYRERISDEDKDDIREYLKEQSNLTFNGMKKYIYERVQDGPTQIQIKTYNHKKLLLSKSEDELLDMAVAAYKSTTGQDMEVVKVNGKRMIVPVNSEKNSDGLLRSEMVEFAMKNTHNMSDKVWNRLKKEGVVYGDRWVVEKKNGKTVLVDDVSTEKFFKENKKKKVPGQVLQNRFERNITA